MTTSEKKEISIDEILKDVNIQNEICKDLLKDKKRNERNLLLFFGFIFVFIIVLLISLFIYFDYSNKIFMTTLDLKTMTTTISNDTDLKTGGNGAITDINKVNISK